MLPILTILQPEDQLPKRGKKKTQKPLTLLGTKVCLGKTPKTTTTTISSILYNLSSPRGRPLQKLTKFPSSAVCCRQHTANKVSFFSSVLPAATNELTNILEVVVKYTLSLELQFCRDVHFQAS